MGFFSKLFGNSPKKETVHPTKRESKAKKDDDDVSIHDVIQFIKINAEGEDGDASCQLQYGIMFATGLAPDGKTPFTKDVKRAIYWLKKSAKQGNLDAIAMLGRVYMDNGDPVTAVKCYQIAAKKGHDAACENLAMAYGMGDGVPEDKVEAHKWFLKAAELGSAFSQYVVGTNYLNGVGTDADPDEAIKWFFAAAEQDEPNAIFELGQVYEIGGGDMKTARDMYQRAAKLGHAGAKQKLAEM